MWTEHRDKWIHAFFKDVHMEWSWKGWFRIWAWFSCQYVAHAHTHIYTHLHRMSDTYTYMLTTRTHTYVKHMHTQSQSRIHNVSATHMHNISAACIHTNCQLCTYIMSAAHNMPAISVHTLCFAHTYIYTWHVSHTHIYQPYTDLLHQPHTQYISYTHSIRQGVSNCEKISILKILNC